MKKKMFSLLLVGVLLTLGAMTSGAISFAAPANAPLMFNAPHSPSGPGEIQGTVFRDFDADGAQDAIEPGVGGVTVKAYSVNGTVAATALTASDGSYTLSGLTDGDNYRVEVTGYPAFLRPSPIGPDNHTTTAFVASPATDIDVGLINPADYTQPTPYITAATYFTGNPMVTGAPANAQALVLYPYTRSGLCQSCGGSAPDPTVLATMGQVGSVWGIAYQRSTHTLFASAFLKRHAGLYEVNGSPKLGMIFKENLSTGAVTPWVDLGALGVSLGTIPSNTSRGLQGNINPSTDADAYAKTTKVGLGDIDISDDESTLWIMSLNDRKLYSLDIANPTSVTGYSVPNPGCTGGDYRPFAVKYHDGDVYIGEVCDASTSINASDLHAYIYKMPGDGSGAFQSVFDFALNYPKGKAWSDGQGTCNTVTGWYAWQDNYPAPCYVNTSSNQKRYVHPMPILSDIEFDYDGSMILGFIDRLGHQIGDKNAEDLVDPPEGTAAAIIGGDILRVCKTSNGYVLEGTAACPNNNNNNEGPGGGEYYPDDRIDGISDHLETSNGGLAVNWQQNQVVVSSMDPFGVNTLSGGTNRFDNTTGAGVTGYVFYYSRDSSGNNTGTFAKANGVGDVELLSDPAPMELGGELWADLGDSSGVGNRNGIHDPGETVVPNADVSLVCDVNGDGFGNDDDVTATTTTDADGRYHFKDGDASLAGFPPAPWDASIRIIPRHTECRILVDSRQPAFGSIFNGSGVATTANNGGSDAGADLRDSDGVANLGNTGKVGIALTTGGSGESDHTNDFGFVKVDWGDAPVSYKTTAADNGPRHVVPPTPKLYLGSEVDSDDNGQPTTEASGDDEKYHDDEDGVTGMTPLTPNKQACITISAVNNTGNEAYLYGWMDLNGNGQFATNEALDNGTAGDYQFTGGKAPVPSGGVSNKDYCFQVPNGSTFYGGTAIMRLRLTTDALTTSAWVGAASNGEVEDYAKDVARVSVYVWNDEAGSSSDVQDASDTGISGVNVRFVWAGPNNTIETTPQNATAQGDDEIYQRTTNSNGVATIIGLTAGTYQVQIANPPTTVPEAVPAHQGADPYKDSDGSQPNGPGQPTTIDFSIPPIMNLSTGEDGNTDNPGGLYGYPDNHDELSYDVGFQNTTKVAIGNTVWRDANGNGVMDSGEAGIGGITMTLYRDADGDGVCEPGSDAQAATTTTGSDGSYIFQNLVASDETDATTAYCVVADKSDLTAAGYPYSSSGGGQDPDASGDQNDDGVPSGNYIVTKPFYAKANGQTNTADSGDPDGYPDASAYMTADFGFLKQEDYDNMQSPNAVQLSHLEDRTTSLPLPGMLILLALVLGGAAVLFAWKRRQAM